MTPLHLAASVGNTKGIEILIENGAILHAEDVQRDTPLHVAVKPNNYDEDFEALNTSNILKGKFPGILLPVSPHTLFFI